MSLSSWIRHYVYLPLSTLRRSPWWHYAALIITMAIFGFWHDAKATMVLWGIYNGLLLVGHRLGQQVGRLVPYRLPSPLGVLLSWGATFMLVCLGYVFFRANDLGQALHMLGAVLTPSSYGLAASTLHPNYYLLVAFTGVGYFIFIGLSQVATLWTNHYTKRPSRSGFPGKPVAAGATLGGTVFRISEMVAVRKWWVLVSVLALLLMIIGLSFQENSSVVPFVYRSF
jgi:alginate O-acetyltransferase complex protein AlgI